ncbi:dienelactone hydrolase family protein [Pseudaminobacter salicylatoxidans]|uniref:Dienelactone hydrolase family protein n=1 Tax=Pseudaminobacter salicylatoxidans TaxID=93369 RepID=A0A316BW38_PSESE|nr:dienelactone hydrolase family protein [Pseudaminobacter salicylatoxidans]
MAKKAIRIETADGAASAGLFGAGMKAGVILYMDAFGPRPALDDMAGRLAAEGYAVLVPDLFYRNAPYGPFDAATAFQMKTARKR